MAKARSSAPAQRAPSKREQNDLSEKAVSEQSLIAELLRLVGPFNPGVVSGVIQDADQGRIAALVDLLHDCRERDGHLHAVLQRREQAIAKIDVQCNVGDKAKARDKKAAEKLEASIRRAKGFRETVAHLVGESCLFGHATVEVVWDLRGGLLVPVEFVRISPRRFGFRRSDAKLLFDPTGNGDVNISGVDLLAEHEPGKFIQIRRRVNGDVPVREGLARVLVWLALFRNWSLKDWFQLAEIAWKPYRKGGWTKGMVKEDRDALELALKRFSSSGWISYCKDTTDIDVEWPKNSISGVSTHKELAEHLGQEMSKAVLCGTTTIEAGNRGARSLGEVIERGLEDVLSADEQVLSEAMTLQLAVPFMAMNFGPRAEVPNIAFPRVEEVDLEKFANGITKLCKEGGLRASADWVRERAGIPEPNEGEELFGGPAEDDTGEDPDEGGDKKPPPKPGNKPQQDGKRAGATG